MHKIDLKKFEIKDLMERTFPLEDLHKQLGNILFVNANSIEISNIARTIHAGKVAEVDENELQEITSILRSSNYYKPFVTLQVVEYLEGIKNAKITKNIKEKINEN